MMVNKATFTVCGKVLHAPMHICGFFDSREQQYEVILPYIKEGLDGNDKVINILEADRHREHCSCLSNHGISFTEKLSSGQLEVLASDQSYYEGGSFAAKKMYQMLENTLISAKRAGYDSVRACGDMVWALKNLPGTEELLEYEASLNQLTPMHSCSLICMYDVSKFSSGVLKDVLQTHPYVIIDGKISVNQFYTDPISHLSSEEYEQHNSLSNRSE